MTPRKKNLAFCLSLVAASLAATVAALGQLSQIKGKVANPNVGTATINSSAPGPRAVQLDLETFRCDGTDEFSATGGDEPFLAVRTYWIDGTTVKLDQLTMANFRSKDGSWSHENLGRKNVKADQAFGIPRAVGSFENTLTPIAPTTATPAGAPAMVAVAVIAMEQDFSSDTASRLFITDGFRKFDEEILRAIRTRSVVDRNQLEKSMVSFLGTKWNALFNHNLLGTADSDDVIGTSFRLYTVPEIEAAGPRGIPFRMGLYKGGIMRGGAYGVEGVVRLKSPPPAPRRDLVFTITHVRQVDDLEGFGRGEPDFQARVVIDGQVFMSPEKSGSPIRPNWMFRVAALKPEIPISVELYERDAGSPDELCDITQVRGRKTLLLRFLVEKNVVSGDRRGKAGEEIVASGVGESDRAEIGFTASLQGYSGG